MRHSAAEKREIIGLVEGSELSVRRTLAELDIPRSTFYGWYRRYVKDGLEGLSDRKPHPGVCWNRVPESVREDIVATALSHPDKSPRELAWLMTDTRDYFISESSVYRILKRCDLITSPAYIVLSAGERFTHPTRRVNELWQTDFTYFRVVGWGWYYLSTVLDDYSRYILGWRLFTSMAASDVLETLDLALEATGVDRVKVRHRPRLLSDNGPCYVSHELKAYLRRQGLEHTRGAPYHPMTQGKIERYHRSMKNVVKLENYYYPWELKDAIGGFVEHYNHHRYHESLNNVTPADVYYGRDQEILSRRAQIKQRTLQKRRIENRKRKVV
jgi:transposase InsO family protein